MNEDELREAASELANTGAPLLVHAELGEYLAPVRGDDYRDYLASRPNAAEDRAIELLVSVCADTGARIHIVHLSSASALQILRESRQLPISAETTTHYLHFDAESIPRGHTEYKCAPPIRERANREKLWGALREGLIDIVVSDHSPCTPSLKQGSFDEAWGGIASVQFVLPVTWTNARVRGFNIHDVARWCCSSTARLAGLENKGAIAVGKDADFAIWSPEETFTVTADLIEHRHKVTPYLGATLHGVVKETWVRGSRVH